MIWHSLIEPRKLVLPKPEDALAGRPEPMRVYGRSGSTPSMSCWSNVARELASVGDLRRR